MTAVSDREQKILGIIETARSKRAKFRDEQINMAHGAGGKATQSLIEGLFVPAFASTELAQLADAGRIEVDGAELAMTTDSYVVRPLRFPGGSIGELAVNGTVNDLAVSAAQPLALLLTFVIEEGIATEILEAELRAIAEAAQRAGVEIVGGDTKVVEHGKADGLYVTTAGIGRADPRAQLSPRSVRPGDQVLLSGPIGDHGITILLARGEIDLEADLRSDTRSVYPFVEASSAWPPPVCAGCAIPRAAASPPPSTSWRGTAVSASCCTRRRSPCARPCAAPASCWASIRCTSPTR